MDFNRLTLKCQEAIGAAQELARRSGNPEITPEHLLLALLDQELPRTLLAGRAAEVQREAAEHVAASCRRSQAAHSSRRSARRSRACSTGPRTRCAKLEDDYVSTEHLLLALDVVPRDELLATLKDVRGAPARHLAGPGGHLPGAREVRPRPDRARRERQARPGHRPRRGDPARDPGALAPHEEQPRADRRARRGQDGDRRGARPAHRRAATCPRASRASGSGSSTSARCSPARSTAASSRSG